MKRLLKVSPDKNHQALFQPGGDSSRWLGLEVLRIDGGSDWKGELGDREGVLVILCGRLSVAIETGETMEWKDLGERADVFGGRPTAVYLPRRSRVRVRAESSAEAVLASAPCDTDLPAARIAPEDVKLISSGEANWRRDVRLVVPPGSYVTQRLIVGETVNPPGNWSGIPPHKHDESSAKENFLEEFYLYKTRPSDGFGIQLTYRKGEEEACFVKDNDVVLFQSGYHPTVAAPGVAVYYLWVLAGRKKDYNLSIDERFSWVPSAEAVLKELKKAQSSM